MSLDRLSRAQKRAHDWRAMLNSEVRSTSLKSRFESTLQSYQLAILECWERNTIGQVDELKLTSLERDLRALEEEARMTISPAR